MGYACFAQPFNQVFEVYFVPIRKDLFYVTDTDVLFDTQKVRHRLLGLGILAGLAQYCRKHCIRTEFRRRLAGRLTGGFLGLFELF